MGNWRSEADCIHELAQVHWLQRKYDQAIERLGPAHGIFTGDRRGVVCCFVSWSTIHIGCREYDQARQKLTEALKMHMELGYPTWSSALQMHLGTASLLAAPVCPSRWYFGQAMDHALSIGSRYEIALCRTGIGYLYRNQCNYTQALEQISTAQALLEEIGKGREAGFYSKLIADIEAKQVTACYKIQA
jgi:tetratricopeptide (TPR) repeat protein